MKVGDVLAVVDAGATAAPLRPPKAARPPRRRPRHRRPPRRRQGRQGRAEGDADRAQDGRGARRRPVRRSPAAAMPAASPRRTSPARSSRLRRRPAAPASAPAAAPALRPPPPPPAKAAKPAAPVAAAGAAARARHPRRDPRAHVEAPPDHRPQPRRGAAHRGHADHLQRGGHDRADGAARAPQAGVQGALRPRPRHRLLLRQGLGGGAARVPPSQRRDPGRGDGAQAVLRHRDRRRRAAGPRRPGDPQRRGSVLRRHRAGDPRVRRQGAERHADARRPQGRLVHDHQRRRLRIDAEHADPEPAAGRHPRPAQDRGSARSPSRARSSSGR